MSDVIMGWGKCTIKTGLTGASEAMASSLAELGIIKEDTATLTVDSGNVLEARETGGKTVAREEMDGNVSLNFRIIEPTNTLYTTFFGTAAGDDGSMVVSTHVVADKFSVEVTPKNTGGIGLRARKCNVTFRPGWNDQEGNYVDITYNILACSDGELYTRFVVSE